MSNEQEPAMDDFLSISLLSLAMLVGCYVAGIIPLAVNFSEVRRLLYNGHPSFRRQHTQE